MATEKDDSTFSIDESIRQSDVVETEVVATVVIKTAEAKTAEAVDYGYGDAAPDSAKANANVDYGYGDAAPDSATDYGYGDAAPDSAAPDRRAQFRAVGRRSSMKGKSGRTNRRASIGAVQTTMEVRLPNNKPLRRRRSIAFEDNVAVKKVEPVKDLAENPDGLWFQSNEYDLMRAKILTLVDHVHRSEDSSGIDTQGGISVGGKVYCSRGLENYLNPELTQLKTSRALGCVLDEQFLQRQIGDFDEETLANIYKFSTVRSQREA
ncbi:MAG: hypothetical protein SGARI_003739, partial [Bacillariaceae sp.]